MQTDHKVTTVFFRFHLQFEELFNQYILIIALLLLHLYLENSLWTHKALWGNSYSKEENVARKDLINAESNTMSRAEAAVYI